MVLTDASWSTWGEDGGGERGRPRDRCGSECMGQGSGLSAVTQKGSWILGVSRTRTVTGVMTGDHWMLGTSSSSGEVLLETADAGKGRPRVAACWMFLATSVS